MRILGLDPGLRVTGWGIVEAAGNRLSHVADGVVTSDDRAALADRLAQLHDGVMAVIERFNPAEAAVEETFVNRNPLSTLKLGQARGVVMLAPARCGLVVAEYTPNAVKKAVVGRGHAEKAQIALMVRTLLPGADPTRTDASDALAVAICHAHLRASQRALMAGARP
ncbi:crossover junction endodeoxyribonuclease RuvC [Roseospira navarrensis]|uniref:Crossover junction endodeoxyribonuclease RuvC n=1 Tax=Roseospira navarrensis TaxID=140058 RepID=A0A7X1ZD80_9PROT|nr:crossover junction endodeoxyribonuclease RuvC [Roseospira navarrensis]MQX36192.1 crossover junction endodeoxyribonuclease RuvC [Roseospira navarrensis]